MTTAVDPAEFRQFLVGLAEALTAADESVDSIHRQLEKTATAYGFSNTEFVVLPTMVLVQTGGDEDRSQVTVRSRELDSLQFNQIAELYRLINDAEQAAIDPADGLRALARIRAMKPRFHAVVRVLGHAILSVGLCLLLIPTAEGVVMAFVLGLLVGLAKLVPSDALQLVLPTLSAFVCAVAVYALAPYVGVGDPLRLLIAPLATFLPGAALTTATVELASREMVAGASRLVTGLMQLALLAVGILAAGAVVGINSGTYRPIESISIFPWWIELVGVVFFAIGIYLYLSVPTWTFAWVLLVMVVAYGVQSLASLAAPPTFSGFFAALVIAPLVLYIARRDDGAPAQITFLPAFWLLVPGASGLIGLTEAAGTDADIQDLAIALTTVLTIALGVLIGTALSRWVAERRRRLVR